VYSTPLYIVCTHSLDFLDAEFLCVILILVHIRQGLYEQTTLRSVSMLENDRHL
jgi:hypothetical protein